MLAASGSVPLTIQHTFIDRALADSIIFSNLHEKSLKEIKNRLPYLPAKGKMK
ncbi:hypothetical protein ACQCWA_17210 [Rossellomorea aquimaris]|uniref:hypothetical protein n=1 Tax=Bacillaceae TaxID=186817 RepID=UPI00165D471F|nr:hypothetical protein [Bacillus sp. CH30_1T]